MTSIFNFLNRLFKWDAGANGLERILTVVFAIFGIVCLGWLIIASYGVGHTALAQAHQAGHGFAETVFATLFFAGAAFWGWLIFSDRVPFKVNDMVAIISLLVLIILGVNANTGFFAHVY